jgi:uncharacterized protein YbjT (DUF2867 family)
MILVIGATGTTGRHVALQLAAAGAKVRAMTRAPARATDLAAAGVEVVEGDLDRPASVEAALSGVERIYLATSSSDRMADVQFAAIRAAQRAGVKHMVKLSMLGAGARSNVLLCRLNHQAEVALKQSRMAWTILRPNFYMQNFLQYASSIAEDCLVQAPAGQGRASQVDARDIAAVAVAALTKPAHEGKTYVVTGPEALSYEDSVRLIAAAAGRDVRYEDIPPETALRQLLAAGVPEWFAKDMVALTVIYATGGAAAVTDVVPALTGRPARTFAQFAKDYARAFGAP